MENQLLMARTNIHLPDGANIRQLRFNTLHLKPQGSIAGKDKLNCTAWRITGIKTQGQQNQHIIRPVTIYTGSANRQNPVKSQGAQMPFGNMPALTHRYFTDLFLPGKRMKHGNKPFFFGLPDEIPYFNNGVLQIDRNNYQIINIKGKKF